MDLQFNLSIADTISYQHFVPYKEVSLSQELPVYYQWAWYFVIGLLSATWLTFPYCTLAERLSRSYE